MAMIYNEDYSHLIGQYPLHKKHLSINDFKNKAVVYTVATKAGNIKENKFHCF